MNIFHGGTGIIWFGAFSVVTEGNGNLRQLFTNKNNYGKSEKQHRKIIANANVKFVKNFAFISFM
jgi:hypothetical protein